MTKGKVRSPHSQPADLPLVQGEDILSGSPLPRPGPSAATTACSQHLSERPRAIIDFAWGGILTRSYYIGHHVSLGQTNPWLPKGIPRLVSSAFLWLCQIQEVTNISFQLSSSPLLSQRSSESAGKPSHTESAVRTGPHGTPARQGSRCPAPSPSPCLASLSLCRTQILLHLFLPCPAPD